MPRTPQSTIKLEIADPAAALDLKKHSPSDRIIALAGNPNVGKSTIFNSLTGMRQHTGNWPGKTVATARGEYTFAGADFILVDLPGCYSLYAHSAEEEVARDCLRSGLCEAVVVVCDATCLERNLNLVLQILELSSNVIVCVNLLDEARRKHIKVDLERLSELLGVPVIGTAAGRQEGLTDLMQAIKSATDPQAGISDHEPSTAGNAIQPALATDNAAANSPTDRAPDSESIDSPATPSPATPSLTDRTDCTGDIDHLDDTDRAVDSEQADIRVRRLVRRCESIAAAVVSYSTADYNRTDRRIDNILTGRLTGLPIMLLLLALIFWLTIIGANYPSQLLSTFFFWLQEHLLAGAVALGIPPIIYEPLILGAYRVLAWVVAVMLPPMAIFFPLFTLLEDLGYLPRVAFNLDKYFKRCCACGKQALTMCMGFGCNAAGITGCRIIDSPRERLLAMLTNVFVPCNGRFPTLISLLTMFFVGSISGVWSSVGSALLLAALIVLGVLMTLLVSKLLSHTLLKGVPSSFTLELPPYRRPQIGRVIVRSIFDRTIFVLGRAVIVAAPAGVIIWICANVTIGDATILNHCADFLDPFAKLLGMDGIILMAFILGIPANEIVLPIIIMAYMASGSILEMESLDALKQLLVDNGWTWVTAVSVMLFSLMHWPCSTTCLTIRKETGSWKWTAIAFIIPTLAGLAVCLLFNLAVRLFI